jgi:subtilisin family serine protease
MLRFLRRWPILATALVAVLALDARPARSGPPAPAGVVKQVASPSLGGAYLRALGPRATEVLAPNSGFIGANVALPHGVPAEALGLDPVAPGIGRMRASAAKVGAFADAHPDLHMEIAPPLHLLMDRAGQWVRSIEARNTRGANGAGVMIGVADTGIDVIHKEMRDASGHTRIAWMLDLSLRPLGVHQDLEDKFSVKDDSGKALNGAVFSRDMIDSVISDLESGACDESQRTCVPTDSIGHGTHVAGIAAATGVNGGKYAGVAPAADIVAVRVTRGQSESIEPDDLQRAVEFMFSVSDAEHKPLVANISLGSDFGPHDGTFMWEQAIASHIGPDHPGHAVVAAAGNVGSIVQSPVHQSVRVNKDTTMRVPIRTFGASSGSVQVWVTLRPGAEMSIGLDGPDGEWIAPVTQGDQAGKNTAEYNAGVIYGSNLDGSPIPPSSHGGVVVWTGAWPSGTYNITLEGEGMAELYMEALGDADLAGDRPAFFMNAVREGTLSAPATHPAVISVGCTVDRARYKSIYGAEIGLTVPLLDESGGKALRNADGTAQTRDITEGEVCWFSSAGPNANGVPKPEIAAPGALVISAMSRSAEPGTPGSIFTSPSCPRTPAGGTDKRCFQVDDTHAVAIGTSMSAPVVSGVVALLFQQDPTLTQDKLVALLQGGAHRFRGTAPYMDQSGPGEVDVIGALDALDRMHDPRRVLPVLDTSWITLSSEYVPADGSTTVTAILELRTEDSEHRADMFESNRLASVLLVDNQSVDFPPDVQRRGPGVWVYTWKPPPGLGGSRATFGATFDGLPIVVPRTIPIATDRWTAAYPSDAQGSGCATVPAPAHASGAALVTCAIGLVVALARRRRAVSVRRAS